jgi:hypothetical protein
LEELIQIFYQAGKVLAELSPDLKKIYTKIHEKIEMPKGLLLEKETEAKAHSPTNHKREYDEFTEAIVNMSAPIDVLLAKQLLVYDRLNRFYM